MSVRSAFLGLALLVLGSAAHATVVSGDLTGGSAAAMGGSFSILDSTQAFTVGKNNFNNNNLYAFNEKQSVVLSAALSIAGGQIAAGTRVSSHFVAFDPLTSKRGIGIVEFSSRIIGVITSRAGLILSSFLGAPSVSYLTPSFVGLEDTDSVSFAGNVLSLDWTASSPGDYIRVITAPASVPLPAAGLMLLGALVVTAGASRRKRT